MSATKTKGIEKLEIKMDQMDADSMRYAVLRNAKAFKTSWVDLGQALYTVWKDKLYKNWGYTEFDTYTAKEIGIRKGTALKLLRSYYFLENEEPHYLKEEYRQKEDARTVPTFEAVNALRMAKKKKEIDREDYADIKKKVLENGRTEQEVRRNLTQLIRQREELNPEEARKKRQQVLLRRLISSLKSIREELRASKMLPASVLSDTNKLLSKLEPLTTAYRPVRSVKQT